MVPGIKHDVSLPEIVSAGQVFRIPEDLEEAGLLQCGRHHGRVDALWDDDPAEAQDNRDQTAAVALARVYLIDPVDVPPDPLALVPERCPLCKDLIISNPDALDQDLRDLRDLDPESRIQCPEDSVPRPVIPCADVELVAGLVAGLSSAILSPLIVRGLS